MMHPSHPFQTRSQQLVQWTYGGILILFSSWSLPVQALPRLIAQPSQPHAIVQLKGLDVPRPRVKGTATMPLKVLDQTQVFTTVGFLGKLPGRFLIDTGASTTLLSAETVQDLKLQGKPVPSDRLTSAVAGNECPTMSASLYQLPPLKLQSVEVQGASALQFQKTMIPDGLSGVMGIDILGQFDLHLNPKALTLKLSPPSSLPQGSTAIAIPLQRKLGVFLAKLNINGQGPFTMLLDTGADSTFISQGLAQKLQLDPKTRQPMKILGFCGLEPAERSRLATVKLQQHEQKDLEAIILSSPILKLLGVDGILGQNFLYKYQQYWRFTPFSKGDLKSDGSLLLTPPESPIK